MATTEVPLVTAYTHALKSTLQSIPNRDVNIGANSAPASVDVQSILQIRQGDVQSTNLAHFAALENATRDTLYELLASTSIAESAFRQVWHLLDVVSKLSDDGQCEPALGFWLIEELLDSQTIDGCRKVFDYLESRRERLTARNFKAKQLVILRSCNELLRRLSRAEDTVFCGRVFIFLFQSFPLGDRSSVNLRGEYHADNVTAFDELPTAVEDDAAMEVDLEQKDTSDNAGAKTLVNGAASTGDSNPKDMTSGLHKHSEKKKTEEPASETKPPIDNDKLYPVFWGLQNFFSQPTQLFNTENLRAFKSGLEMTMTKFKEVSQVSNARNEGKALDENKRGTKRKRDGSTDDLANSFNPKYLTSRDLFELELSDLAFRRHILVQALVLLDFLLSLSPKAKSKTQNESNKSVLYTYTLEEEDVEWVTNVRNDIATYLQQGPEGKFYYRMVDTVLSRDKNWVRWKAEGCPAYQKPPVNPEDYVSAREGAQKACANKRIRQTPMGSLDLNFLSDGETTDGLERLKDPARFTIPSAESFKSKIAEDEFDISMAKDEEEKQLATNARASKLWRTLRIAAKSRLKQFDKIDDTNILKVLFESPMEDHATINGGEDGGKDGSDRFDEVTSSSENLVSKPAITSIMMEDTAVT
ncbi:hypothetical protein MMC25_005445 [Agyrium rufum]|nr:hypothetical protein [Agyrium rufum]